MADRTARRERRSLDHSLFSSGNHISFRKDFSLFFYTEDEPSRSALESNISCGAAQMYPCTVMGCSEVFQSVFDCDAHFQDCHVRECGFCRASFPNEHVLDLVSSFFGPMCWNGPGFSRKRRDMSLMPVFFGSLAKPTSRGTYCGFETTLVNFFPPRWFSTSKKSMIHTS